MIQHQEKRSENKAHVTAANTCGCNAAVQLKDNREQSVVQQKLQEKAAFAPVIQRVVRPNRGGSGFRSTLTGQVYPTEEAANAAEVAYEAEQARLAQEERPQVAFIFQPPQEGPPTPQTPLADALLNHPVHFGPLLTTGGDVTGEQANLLAGSTVIPESQSTAYSARNTHAMVFSSGLDDIHVHSHSGTSTPVSNISNATHPVAEFYENHKFMQGAPPPHVHLPGGRTNAHAEAHAVHSDAFRSAVRRNAEDIQQMNELTDFDPALGIGDQSEEQFQNTIRFLSGMPVSTQVAINRASCGQKGKSGYAGGCNQEMADTGEEYVDLLGQHIDPSLAFLATQTGMASFGASAAGPYKHQGNPALMTESGVEVNMHNAFDWNTGQAKHLSEDQQEYQARAQLVDPVRREESKKRKREEKKKKIKIVIPSNSPSDKKQGPPPPPPPPPASQGIIVN